MSILLAANNAKTTLAGPISSGALAVNLAAGTGSLFPALSIGSYFELTFTDAATGLLNEIVYVTARSGDTCTIVRGQEGTTARAWNVGDIAANYWTAGQGGMGAMIQIAQLQQQATNFANDVGTANNYVVSLTPAPPFLAYLTGVPIRVRLAHTNTGASALAVNGLASTIIINTNGTQIAAGQLTAGGIFEFVYDGVNFQVSSPLTLLSQTNNTWLGSQFIQGFLVLKNNIAMLGRDTSGGLNNVIGFMSDNNVHIFSGTNGLIVSNQANNLQTLIVDNVGNGTFAAAVTAGNGNVFAQNGRLRATFGAFGSGDALASSTLSDFASSQNVPGFCQLPNGLVLQWGNASVTSTSAGLTTLNVTLPHTNITQTLWAGVGWFGNTPPSGGSVGIAPINASTVAITTFAVGPGTEGVTWWAIGN